MMKKVVLAFAVTILLLSGSVLTAAAQPKRSWVSPKTGVWRVVAKDEENEVWNGRLTLIRKGDDKYRGHFYWNSADKTTSGYEYFTGSFVRSTGKLRLKAYAVKNVKGELGTGMYVASVSRQGRNITRGSWSGEESIPGKWSAVWLKAR